MTECSFSDFLPLLLRTFTGRNVSRFNIRLLTHIVLGQQLDHRRHVWLIHANVCQLLGKLQAPFNDTTKEDGNGKKKHTQCDCSVRCSVWVGPGQRSPETPTCLSCVSELTCTSQISQWKVLFWRPVDESAGAASLDLTPPLGKDLMAPSPLRASSIVLCLVPADAKRKKKI